MADEKLKNAGISAPHEIPAAVRKELEKLTEAELKSLVEAKKKLNNLGPLDTIGVIIF